MRPTAPLVAVAVGACTLLAAGTASAATKTPTKATTKTVCAVAKDGKLKVEAVKAVKTSTTKGGTETVVSKAGKTAAKAAFLVGRTDSFCLAPGSYTVVLKTAKSSTKVKAVVVKKDTVTLVKATVK